MWHESRLDPEELLAWRRDVDRVRFELRRDGETERETSVDPQKWAVFKEACRLEGAKWEYLKTEEVKVKYPLNTWIHWYEKHYIVRITRH